MSKDFSQQAEEQLQNAISSVEPCNDYEFTNYNRDGWCYTYPDKYWICG